MAFGVLHLSDIHFRENETEIQEGKLRQQRLGHADGSPVTDTIYNTRNQRGRKAYCGATWQRSLGNFGRHLDGKGKRLPKFPRLRCQVAPQYATWQRSLG